MYFNAADYLLSTLTDDAAVQAAVDDAEAAGGGTVVIPSKTGGWTFQGTVRWPSNVRIVMYGTYITCSAAGLPLFYGYASGIPLAAEYGGYSNLVMEGGVLDMRAHENPVAHNVITVAHGENITFRDVTVRNVASFHAIETHAVRNVLIENCRFEGWVNYEEGDPYREAIQVDSVNMNGDDGTPTKSLTVKGCYFGPSADCGSWGTGVGSHTIGASLHEDIKIRDCTFDSTQLFGVRALSWVDVSVLGCEFTGVGRNAVHVGCLSDVNCRTVAVADNIINSSGTSGIRFETVGGGRYSDIEVQANIVRYSGSNAMLFRDVDWGNVSNNVIRRTTANYGMQIGVGSTATATGLTVANNQIYGTDAQGFRLNYAQLCQFTGNRVRSGTGGFYADGTNTGTSVVGNFLDGNGWAPTTALAGTYAGIKTTWAGGSSLPGDNLL